MAVRTTRGRDIIDRMIRGRVSCRLALHAPGLLVLGCNALTGVNDLVIAAPATDALLVDSAHGDDGRHATGSDSTSPPDTTPPPDAVPDTSAPLVSEPGKVRCVAARCTSPTPHCCNSYSGPSCGIITSCSTADTLQCDERADCDSSKLCCSDKGGLSSTCETGCAYKQLCMTASECGSPATNCVPFMVGKTTLGRCE